MNGDCQKTECEGVRQQFETHCKRNCHFLSIEKDLMGKNYFQL